MIAIPVDQADQKIYQKTNTSNYTRPEQSSGRISALIPEEFSTFLAGLDPAVESGLLVIPRKNHYFYDSEEMKRVKTLVNLMKLNNVRELKGFVRKLSELLPRQANFVGCFVDDTARNRFSLKNQDTSGMSSEIPESFEVGIESRIPFVNRIYGFIDARTDRHLTRRSVANLLYEFGFQALVMKELNGVTYFHSRKVTSGFIL